MSAERTRRWGMHAALLSVALGGTCTAQVSAAQAEPEVESPSTNSARRDRTYLLQLAFVLEGARRVLLFGEAHAADPELARFVYPMSEQFVEMAGRMMPGDRLKIAHPHVLLVVENVERAFSASSHGDLHTFRQHVRTIREELATLDAVLKHLKVRLPEPVR